MALVAASALITPRVFVWPVTGSLPLGNWPYQIACEWGERCSRPGVADLADQRVSSFVAAASDDAT